MKLRRIEIRNFRRFTVPLVIDAIGDGLTVLAGDNEEGKSTVLRALRAALFDRHGVSKEVARELVPFRSEVQPEVALDFELAEGRYRLRKGFYQKPFARLELPSGARVEGLAAEQKLQELLRFESPGRGLSSAADHGILGLLWLEQGVSFANWNAALTERKDRRDGPAQRSLLSALESEVGEVLGGARGREILDAISRRYSEFYDKNRRPRGEFAKRLESERELSAKLEEIERELRQYETQIDELTVLRERLARYEQKGDLLRAQRERQDAEAEARRIEALSATLREAEQGKKIAEAHLQAAVARFRQREAERKRVADCVARVQVGREALAAARQKVQPQQAELSQAQQALRAAQDRQKRADEALRRCLQAERMQRLEHELAELSKRHQQALSAHAHAGSCRAKADAIAIDDKRLRLIQKLDRERAEAEAGLQAVATRLSFALREGIGLKLQGQRLAVGPPLHMTETTQLELMQGETSLGTLTITPGAEDLGERRARVEAAAEKLRRELAACGAVDVAMAEARTQERAELLMQAQQHERLLQVHAPEGIEALREARQRVEAEYTAQRGGESAPAEGENLDETASPARQTAASETPGAARERLAQQVAAARHESEQAAREVKLAQAVCDRQAQAWQSVQEGLTRQQVELESSEREQRHAEEALLQARGREADEALQQALLRAQEERTAADASAQAAQGALQQARPDEVKERLESRQRAVELIQRDIDGKRQRATFLEGELQALGQQGLGERREELLAERERARALSARMAKEAEALRLLLDTLQAAEREAKETFFAPVQARIQPYLSQVFPGCSLRFSDGNLAIEALRRGDLDEPFDSLSIGTREQIAILTRLAFADLLREQGQPTCIVLDDALVYADDGRFERMLSVLRRAAKGQQILILTCRERDYQLKGIETRRLSDCLRRDAA